MGKSTISMAIFNSKLLNFQRVNPIQFSFFLAKSPFSHGFRNASATSLRGASLRAQRCLGSDPASSELRWDTVMPVWEPVKIQKIHSESVKIHWKSMKIHLNQFKSKVFSTFLHPFVYSTGSFKASFGLFPHSGPKITMLGNIAYPAGMNSFRFPGWLLSRCLPKSSF